MIRRDKKYTALLMAALLACSLAGCSKSTKEEKPAEKPTEAVTEAAETEKPTEAVSEVTAETEKPAEAVTESVAETERKMQSVYVALSGGSGRASIASPTVLMQQDGKYYAVLTWSSSNYDYMIVDGEKYLNEASEGSSTFTIPVRAMDEPIEVIADTTAMSTPHEITYELTFSLSQPGAQDNKTAQTENSEPSEKQDASGEEKAAQEKDTQPESVSDKDVENIEGLEVTGRMELAYATQFSVTDCGDLTLIGIGDDQKFLIAPEGASIPEGLSENLPEEIRILSGYPSKTYLVSSSAMDLVRAAKSMEHVRFCGTKENDWYIEDAAAAMQDGSLLYAGKYSAPDYELLISQECDLAVENTMISHNPQVQEKLETLGIPVMIERSSYEAHPLGRLEWVRFYGALFGEREAADAYFQEQIEKIGPVLDQENTNLSAAFFSINTSGAATIRKPGDYISKSIELAGGHYVFEDKAAEADNALSTMNMQLEDFYAGAREADVLIYNGTIEGELESLTDLLEKSTLFEDFKAFKSGYVFSASKNLFQQTTGTAQFILDLNTVFEACKAGKDPSQLELTYLRQLM